MLRAIHARHGRHFQVLPNGIDARYRRPAIRGRALRDLYATVPIVVGDSCLAGGVTRYVSDRIPETLGRGGFLIHPHVEGVTDGTLFESGVHLQTFEVGDHERLLWLIDHYLANPAERAQIAAAGREHVLGHHTYEHRMRSVLSEMGLG